MLSTKSITSHLYYPCSLLYKWGNKSSPLHKQITAESFFNRRLFIKYGAASTRPCGQVREVAEGPFPCHINSNWHWEVTRLFFFQKCSKNHPNAYPGINQLTGSGCFSSTSGSPIVNTPKRTTATAANIMKTLKLLPAIGAMM